MTVIGRDNPWQRPGMLAGPYPERGATANHDPPRRRRLRDSRVLALVTEAGRDLGDLDEAALGRLAVTLRRELRGAADPARAQARAFALVAECAARRLGLRPHHTQILAGWAMLERAVVEMDTGEGKTLAATLPAATAALAGVPVHVVTTNDYLAARDAGAMTPLFEALGLRVGLAGEALDVEQRRAAYACDVTYCSSRQLVFDYLRDLRALGSRRGRLSERLAPMVGPARSAALLRGLNFAIVDEADSVLVDEAGTPALLARERRDDAGEVLLRQALAFGQALRPGEHFQLDEPQRQARLTEAGSRLVADMAGGHGGAWRSARAREELVVRALAALHLYRRDRDYLVRDGGVRIIDPDTGRVLADRSWQHGLQQLVELREDCAPSAARETELRITYQSLFGRYLRLAGMTGTATEVSAELRRVYGLRVRRIRPLRPSLRRSLPERLFTRASAKWRQVVERTIDLHRQGRPVLIGTRTVADSEHVSALLAEAGVPHRVLNARQDAEEADVIARAGQRGAVTVATNMAGRGTDIRLGDGVAALGGLHVIACERQASRRLDRQLFGRTARQGEPGSVELVTSLEDELLHRHLPAAVAAPLARLAARGPLTGLAAALPGALAQRAASRGTSRARRRMLLAERRLADALCFTGGGA